MCTVLYCIWQYVKKRMLLLSSCAHLISTLVSSLLKVQSTIHLHNNHAVWKLLKMLLDSSGAKSSSWFKEVWLLQYYQLCRSLCVQGVGGVGYGWGGWMCWCWDPSTVDPHRHGASFGECWSAPLLSASLLMSALQWVQPPFHAVLLPLPLEKSMRAFFNDVWRLSFLGIFITLYIHTYI